MSPVRSRLKRLACGALVAAASFLYIGTAQASTTTIAGTLNYTYDGTQNMLNAGQFIVLLTSNPYGSVGGNEYIQAAQVLANPGGAGPHALAFRFTNVPDGTYYLSAYRDLNGDGVRDPSEPWGAYPTAGAGVAGGVVNTLRAANGTVFLGGSASSGPFDFTVKDAPNARLSGTITYTGGKTGIMRVKAKVPDPYCSGVSCSGLTVALATAGWTASSSTLSYAFLVPAATGYTMAAQLVTSGSGGEHDDDSQFPSAKSFTGTAFDLLAKDDVVKSTTIRNPGWANTGNTSPAAPSNQYSITGSVSYAGSSSGTILVVIFDSQGDTRESLNITYSTYADVGAVRVQGPFTGSSAKTFTIKVASPTVGWFDMKEYVLAVGLDVDGDGLLNDKTEPLYFNATAAPIGTGVAGTNFDEVTKSSNVGVVTLLDPTATNTGEIDGTVFIASGAPSGGNLVVRARNQRQGSCDKCSDERSQTIPIVPGQASYSYQLKGLDSATNYFLIAFVDSNGNGRFSSSQSTFSNFGNSSNPNWISEPVGMRGLSTCPSGACTATQPVAVATNAAMVTFFGSTCGANHTTSCAGTPATATGIDFVLVVPTTAPPAAVTLSTQALSTGAITWQWGDVATENGFRLVDASSVNVSGDLVAHTLSYFDSLPFNPNTPVTRGLVSFNSSGNSTSTFRTVFTRAATPDTANRGSTVTAAAMTVGWSSGTQGTGPFNPLTATAYTVVLSTVSPFTAGALTAGGNVAAFSTAPAGAQPEAAVPWGASYLANTTYYAYVNAVNGDGLASVAGSSSGYALVGQGISPPAAPASVASTFTVVNATHSMSASWSANGNAGGTTYNVAFSTVGALSGGAPAGADTVALSTIPAGAVLQATAVAGLKANTTYYLFVQAVGSGGLNSLYIPLGSTSTLANVPGSAGLGSTVTFAAAVIGWTSGTAAGFNPLDRTTYTVVLSTVTPFSAAALTAAGNPPAFSTAPAGFAPQATVPWGVGYSTNAVYHAYVRAVNNNGVPTAFFDVGSATAPPAAPAQAATTFLVVNATHAMSVSWLANGNPGGTAYNVSLSTVGALDAGGSPAGSDSVTLPSTAPAGAALQATIVAGLKANTTYFLFVQTVGGSGLNSPYGAMGSTSTLANVPATAGVAPAVTAAAMVVTWASGTSAGFNPLDRTTYTVVLSTVTPFSAAALTAAGNIPVLSTAPKGLQPQATVSWGGAYLPSLVYHAYVDAVNNNGIATAFVDVGQGSSPPALPASVASTFTAVNSTGVMSVSWSANNNAVNVTTYTVALSTVGSLAAGAIAAGNTVTLTTHPAGAALQATLAGLNANTTYYLYVKTLDNGGNGLDTAFVALGSTSTLAVDAANAGLGSTVTFAAMTVGWASGTAAGYNPLNTTLYRVVLSTVTPFSAAALTASGNMPVLSTTPVGSPPQATVPWAAGYLSGQVYYAYVNAVNNNGVPSANYFAVASGTAPPASPTAAAVPFTVLNATHAMSVSWTGNNPPGTNYNVALSTVAALPPSGVPASAVILPSTAPAGTTLQATIATGLNANTTYYLFVQTVGGSGLNSPYVSVGSSSTLAALPAATAFTAAALSGSQYYLGWAAGSAAGGFNPQNSTYTVLLSTVPSLAAGALSAPANEVLLTTAPAGAAPSATYPLSAAALANTTYYVYVNAINNNNIATAYVLTGATATLANAPKTAVSTFSYLAVNSATASWSAAGNPLNVTTYTVVMSTVPSVFLGASTAANDKVTVGVGSGATPSLALTGLAANTTYYLFVRALNHNGVPSDYTAIGSTATLANPPAANTALSTYTVVGSTTLSLRWLSSNPPQNTPVANTTYTVVMSTVNSLAAGALTAAGNVLLATAPADGASVGATVSGLASNTTYFAYVNAVNPGSTGSSFVAFGSTVTFASQPAPLAPTGVGSSSATANWGANGNAAGTAYVVKISSDGFATVNQSSQTTATSFSFSGLTGGINYFFMVAAVSYDGSLGGFTVLPPATTLGGTLTAPAAAAFSGVGITSITANWSAGAGNPAGTVYRVQLATASNFSSVNFSSVTANTSVLFGAGGAGVTLSSNTLYYVQVQSSGTGVGALSAFTALGSTYTLAAPPTGSVAAAVNSSSATITWGANGNPSGTTASVERSSVPTTFVIQKTSAGVFPLSFSAVDLLGCSSYTFRVRNLSASGIPTGYDAEVNFLTKPATPTVAGAFTATSLASNRIALSWTPSPTSGISAYKVYIDSGTGVAPSTGSAAQFIMSVSSAVTSTTTAVLVSSNAYIFRLSAVHSCGVEEGLGVFASAAATGTLSALRVALGTPQSGAVVSNDSNALTLSASILSGADTPNKVVFQYKKDTAAAFTVISTATVAPFTATWQLSPVDLSRPKLAAGTYLLRAVAFDSAGNSDAQPASITVNVVDPAGALANLTPNFVEEKVDVVGKVTKTQVISDGAPNAVSSQSGGLVVSVDLPAGALGTPYASITVKPNVAAGTLPPAPAGLSMLQPLMVLSDGLRPSALTAGTFATQISLGNGVTLQPGSAVTVSLSYPDVNNTGTIDGTNIKPADVKLYSASEAAGSPWVGDLTMLAPDLVNHKIRGTTAHFSFFGGFGAPAANLAGVRVYPVPWKPNGGNADEGVPFSPGNAKSGVIFDGLTGDATITIYNISGSRVASFSNNGGGTVQWDGRNDSGRDVATGGYFAVIKGSGTSVVKRLAIIR